VTKKRWALVAGGVVLVAAAVAGLWRFQLYEKHRSESRALRSYISKVGPPTRALNSSWTEFTQSIGTPAGTNEDAVRQSFETARALKSLLDSLQPPNVASLFHQELVRIVANVLTVVEDRLSLALGSQGASRLDVERKRVDAGGAFYVVNQTFPQAMDALKDLEAGIRR
jgi:hypothetical protein